MQLSSLETFIVVAEELHFRRAAELLHLQPSTVSNTISQLERHYGVLLFERTSRKVVLTPAGRHLVERARDILNRADALETEWADIARPTKPRLRIGFWDEGAAELQPIIFDPTSSFPSSGISGQPLAWSLWPRRSNPIVPALRRAAVESALSDLDVVPDTVPISAR